MRIDISSFFGNNKRKKEKVTHVHFEPVLIACQLAGIFSNRPGVTCLLKRRYNP